MTNYDFVEAMVNCDALEASLILGQFRGNSTIISIGTLS